MRGCRLHNMWEPIYVRTTIYENLGSILWICASSAISSVDTRACQEFYTHMLTLTTAETLAIDNSMDHLAPGNGRIYPSLVPEQGGPGAGDIEAGLWERPVKTRVGVPTRLIWPSALTQIRTHMLTQTTKDTPAIDDRMDHLAPGNGRIYPKSSTRARWPGCRGHRGREGNDRWKPESEYHPGWYGPRHPHK